MAKSGFDCFLGVSRRLRRMLWFENVTYGTTNVSCSSVLTKFSVPGVVSTAYHV
jgi:hypothetical protein